jgi:hypothetical protein
MRDRKRLYTTLLFIAILVAGGLALFSRPEQSVLAGPLEFTYPADVESDSASYSLPWEAFAGGGSLTASSASYSMQSTFGQAVTGETGSASYDVCSGFWCGIKEWVWDVFLPLALRD